MLNKELNKNVASNNDLKSNRNLNIYYASNCDLNCNYYHLIIDEKNKEYDLCFGSTTICNGVEHKDYFYEQRDLFAEEKRLKSLGYKRFDSRAYVSGKIN